MLTTLKANLASTTVPTLQSVSYVVCGIGTTLSVASFSIVCLLVGCLTSQQVLFKQPLESVTCYQCHVVCGLKITKPEKSGASRASRASVIHSLCCQYGIVCLVSSTKSLHSISSCLLFLCVMVCVISFM